MNFSDSSPSSHIVKVLDGAHLTNTKLSVYLYAWQMSAPHYTSVSLTSNSIFSLF